MVRPALDWRRQYPASAIGLRRRRRRPHTRARAEGAEIFREPETNDYEAECAMDRTSGALDPDGHLWFFMQRLRDPPPVSPA